MALLINGFLSLAIIHTTLVLVGPWLTGCSPNSSYASLLADLPSLVIREELLSTAERVRLFVVDASVAHVGAIEGCTVGLCEDVVGFNTAAEGACAGNRLALLLAWDFRLNTVED